MLDPRWYDKIASSAAEAEAALADAAGEEQGAIEKIQEDIEIAQQVAATDLPTDVKVEIMEDQGVDPEIISEVIDADTTDAVAAYYGVDPYWLHDKRAARVGMKSTDYAMEVLNKLRDEAASKAVAAGLSQQATNDAMGMANQLQNAGRARVNASTIDNMLGVGKKELSGAAAASKGQMYENLFGNGSAWEKGLNLGMKTWSPRQKAVAGILAGLGAAGVGTSAYLGHKLYRQNQQAAAM